MSARNANERELQHDARGDEQIRVVIRIRPPEELHMQRAWSSHENSILPVPPDGNSNSFVFDHTFGENITTQRVYDTVARDIVKDVTKGLNGTIFAYGQTNSGKTYTMQGDDENGIIQMAARDIFSHISCNHERVYLLRVSVLEIYNEEVRDLLDKHKKLKIREDTKKRVFVDSKEVIVTDLENVIDVIEEGVKRRVVRKNGLNEFSSRSHAIFRLTLESRPKANDEMGDGYKKLQQDGEDKNSATLVSTLNLVDLAGSESVRYTNTNGERLKEGGKINQSLLTLSKVISSLGQPNPPTHINFRDSKLTRLLQPFLSGNSRTAIICCITPSALFTDETKSTLYFASRAKLVKTRPQTNEVLDDASLIKRLQKDLADMKKGMGSEEAIQKQLKELEQEAANAEIAAKAAEEKLRRVQGFLWRGSVLLPGGEGIKLSANKNRNPMRQIHRGRSTFVYNDGKNCFAVAPRSKPRRYTCRNFSLVHKNDKDTSISKSDKISSCLNDNLNAASRRLTDTFFSLPRRNQITNEQPTSSTDFQQISRKTSGNVQERHESLPSASNKKSVLMAEVDLLKEALSAKGNQVRLLQSELDHSDDRILETLHHWEDARDTLLTKLLEEKDFLLQQKDEEITSLCTQHLMEMDNLTEEIERIQIQNEDFLQEKVKLENRVDELLRKIELTIPKDEQIEPEDDNAASMEKYIVTFYSTSIEA